MEQRNIHTPGRFKIRHILLGLLLVLLAWFAFFRVSVYRGLSRRVRDLRAQGYPMSLEELDRSYQLPAGGDNAADYYLTAFSYYVPGDDEAREGLPWVSRGQAPARTEPLEPAIRARAEQFLAANEKTLSLLHEAVASDHCQYPMNLAQESGADVSWLPDARKSAFLLSLEGLAACERGDPNQALASVHATLALADSLTAPALIHRLARIAIHGVAYRDAEYVLNRVTLTDVQLQTMLQWLATSNENEGLREAVIGERCLGLDIFRGSTSQLAEYSGGMSKLVALIMIPRKILGLHDNDMLGYVNLMQDYIEVADLPPRERLTACDSINKATNGGKRGGLLTQMLRPALGRIFEIETRWVAHDRVTRTALAVERYRLAEGRLPRGLDDLVPAFLEAVPEDPFDGQDLRYRLLETGFVVYSIGDDSSDDGGTERDERKRHPDGRTMWDVTFFVER